MKKIAILVFLVLISWSCKKIEEPIVKKQNDTQINTNENYLIGTYTDSLNQGINVLTFDTFSKKLATEIVIPGIENPSFLITNKAQNLVVAVGETISKNGGKVTSFSYDKNTNSFLKVSSFDTKGGHPCTLAFSPKEDAIVVGNYSGGNLTVFPINKEGIITNEPYVIQHSGSSISKSRQEKPHVHCVKFHPKEKVVLITDLGNDTIDIIPFTDDSNFELLADKTISLKVPPGSGPRHVIFDNTGKYAFVTFELTNEIAVFEFENNKLKLKEVVALTDVQTTSGSAAELRLSKDNQFLYATVRGNDNKIVCLKVNQGNLERIQSVSTGDCPRNFILSQSEEFVLVANQKSNNIELFARDKKTGLLTKTSSEVKINKPVYFYPF